MKKRLFIAVDISEEVRTAAADHIDSLSNSFPEAPAKWERPEKLHLTLKFLGGTDEDAVQNVKDVMIRIAKLVEPFKIEIGSTGAFPSAGSPRVLWLGVNEPSGRLKQVAKLISMECEQFGFESETRPFKPHLTLARIRYPRNVGELVTEHLHNSFGPIISPCSELLLYESQLGRNGSKYIRLLEAPFSDQCSTV